MGAALRAVCRPLIQSKVRYSDCAIRASTEATPEQRSTRREGRWKTLSPEAAPGSPTNACCAEVRQRRWGKHRVRGFGWFDEPSCLSEGGLVGQTGRDTSSRNFTGTSSPRVVNGGDRVTNP